LVGIPGECRGLERREGFESLAARDGEGPCLVGAGEAAGAVGDVAARALGGAPCLVAELGVADVRGLDREQQLDRDVKRDELVMG